MFLFNFIYVFILFLKVSLLNSCKAMSLYLLGCLVLNHVVWNEYSNSFLN